LHNAQTAINLALRSDVGAKVISVIKALMAGDDHVLDHFRRTEKFWEDFFVGKRDADVSILAKALSDAQFRFEALLGNNRGLAKEIMPYTALAYLYDEGAGFDDNRKLAERLIPAFAKSTCSLEVQFSAKRAARLFNLDLEE